MFTFDVLSIIRISFIFYISFLATSYIVNHVLELYFSKHVLPILLLLFLLMKNIILVQILIFRCCVL